MKNQFIISFLLTSLVSGASFAVADNYQTTNTYSPSGGSLSNTLSADGNSASNNGMIGTSSSATANKLDSSISNVSRLENTNQQFGNSAASLGNISNNSAGGAGGAGGYATSNSGSNTLSNGQGQDQQMGQGQTSSNSSANNSGANTTGNNTTTTVNGGNTTVERNAPPLINTQIVPAGSNGFNIGATTIMGGASAGITLLDKSVKEVNRANAELIKEQRNTTLIDNTEKACKLLTEKQCTTLKNTAFRKLNK